MFARRIADELEALQREDQFDELVLIAAPEVLGDLREVHAEVANQAMQAAQASQSCCDATNEKIDRAFKKAVSK